MRSASSTWPTRSLLSSGDGTSSTSARCGTRTRSSHGSSPRPDCPRPPFAPRMAAEHPAGTPVLPSLGGAFSRPGLPFRRGLSGVRTEPASYLPSRSFVPVEVRNPRTPEVRTHLSFVHSWVACSQFRKPIAPDGPSEHGFRMFHARLPGWARRSPGDGPQSTPRRGREQRLMGVGDDPPTPECWR